MSHEIGVLISASLAPVCPLTGFDPWKRKGQVTIATIVTIMTIKFLLDIAFDLGLLKHAMLI